jgi:hypothetical protein
MIHSTTLDASSLYDAAEKATQSWARLWWFAEHWDTLEAIPPRDQWKNSNGKF